MEKGYYSPCYEDVLVQILSQSTIKMEKGYYRICALHGLVHIMSQSTIKMEKGYYSRDGYDTPKLFAVAIHNKNGKGLLLYEVESPYLFQIQVAIHNKNGKGLLPAEPLTANAQT